MLYFRVAVESTHRAERVSERKIHVMIGCLPKKKLSVDIRHWLLFSDILRSPACLDLIVKETIYLMCE